jgi:hypothetical protein
MESERSDCRPILAQAALPSDPREFNIIVKVFSELICKSREPLAKVFFVVRQAHHERKN